MQRAKPRLGIAPIVLGGGNPPFKPLTERRKMQLLEAKPFQSGCVFVRYAPVA